MPHAEYHMPHSWKYFLDSPLNQLYISLAVRAFAFSIISLFVPAYLYSELGYSFSEVLFFFIYFAIVMGLSAPMFILLSTKIGFKHTIMLSIPIQMIYFYLLHMLSYHTFSLIWVAIALGLGLASFNSGLHLEFHAISHPKSRGEEVGKRQAAQFIGLMFGPLIGGGLIYYFGFTLVFILVGLLLFGSGIFLFLSKEHKVKMLFSWKKLFRVFNYKLALYYLYRGAWIIATGVLWPLYIFFELGDYLSLGVIGTLMALVTAFLVFFVGKKSDSFGKHKVVQYSVVPEALAWIFRGFVATFTGIIGMSLFQSLTSSSLQAPLMALEYNHANDDGALLEYFIWREFFVSMGRVLLLGFLLLVGSFMASFALVGVGTFFVFLL